MKEKVVQTWKYLAEQRFFGVCTYIGEKLGLSDSRIRLYFIYISFLTLGSPIIVYLFMAFWMDLKYRIIKTRRSVWDL